MKIKDLKVKTELSFSFGGLIDGNETALDEVIDKEIWALLDSVRTQVKNHIREQGVEIYNPLSEFMEHCEEQKDITMMKKEIFEQLKPFLVHFMKKHGKGVK